MIEEEWEKGAAALKWGRIQKQGGERTPACSENRPTAEREGHRVPPEQNRNETRKKDVQESA